MRYVGKSSVKESHVLGPLGIKTAGPVRGNAVKSRVMYCHHVDRIGNMLIQTYSWAGTIGILRARCPEAVDAGPQQKPSLSEELNRSRSTSSASTSTEVPKS